MKPVPGLDQNHSTHCAIFIMIKPDNYKIINMITSELHIQIGMCIVTGQSNAVACWMSNYWLVITIITINYLAVQLSIISNAQNISLMSNIFMLHLLTLNQYNTTK